MPLTPIAIKIYTAIITQNSTDPPISRPLNNTLGITNTTWTRNNAGDYQLDTNIDYDVTKLTLATQSNGSAYKSQIPLLNNAGNPATIKVELQNASGKLRISLKTFSGSPPLAEELSEISNQLYLPEIRLYHHNIKPFE